MNLGFRLSPKRVRLLLSFVICVQFVSSGAQSRVGVPGGALSVTSADASACPHVSGVVPGRAPPNGAPHATTGTNDDEGGHRGSGVFAISKTAPATGVKYGHTRKMRRMHITMVNACAVSRVPEWYVSFYGKNQVLPPLS